MPIETQIELVTVSCTQNTQTKPLHFPVSPPLLSFSHLIISRYYCFDYCLETVYRLHPVTSRPPQPESPVKVRRKITEKHQWRVYELRLDSSLSWLLFPPSFLSDVSLNPIFFHSPPPISLPMALEIQKGTIFISLLRLKPQNWVLIFPEIEQERRSSPSLRRTLAPRSPPRACRRRRTRPLPR